MEGSVQRVVLPLNSVCYRDGNLWVAHCLELDIVGQGGTEREATDSLKRLVRLALDDAEEQGSINHLIRPAPPEVWRMWFQAQRDKARGSKGHKSDPVHFKPDLDSLCVGSS